MYICPDDFIISDEHGSIDVLDIDHVVTQADGTLLFNITLLDDGQIKQSLFSSDELHFERKASAE